MPLDSTLSAEIDPDYYWRHISSCPRSVKVQLLGQDGVAVYGQYDGKDPFWIMWAPLPKKPKVNPY